MNGITLFQAFPVVDLLGFMDGLPEGDWPAVLGNLFQPGRPAVGEHEVRLRNPQFFPFLSHRQIGIYRLYTLINERIKGPCNILGGGPFCVYIDQISVSIEDNISRD